MWDVSGTSAELQEGFQPGRWLGRGWKGSPWKWPRLSHSCICAVPHTWGSYLTWLWGEGSSVGLPGIWGVGRTCLPIPGWGRAGFVPAQLGCGWDRATLWFWALQLLGTAQVSASPRVLLVTHP